MQPAPPGPSSLPRALDVQKFAAAREQEIRALQAAVKAGVQGDKYGVAALPRHLRRRTRSHKPYKHSKRPNAKRQRTDEAAPAGQAGALPEQVEPAAALAEAGPPAVWENRRMRRSAGRLQAAAQQACTWDEAAVLGGSGDSAAGRAGSSAETLKRLESHVWHAKRLAMTQRWGWHLPEGAAGRGLGSRSFAHQLRTGVVVHDASYWCPVHLTGDSRALLSLLRSMLSPQDGAAVARLAAGAVAAPAHHQQQQNQGDSDSGSGSGGGGGGGGGGCGGGYGSEVEAVLHHAADFPQRAIGPVRIMCLPGSSTTTAAASPAGAAGGAEDREGTTAMDMDVPGGDASPASQEPPMQLCMWVHAAAAAAALAALREAAAAACASPAAALVGTDQQPVSGTDAAASDMAQATEPGQCQLEVGVLDLRRLEVRGGAADRALAAALFAQDTQRQQGQGQGQQEPRERSAGLPPAVQRLGGGEALRLLLPDPRLAKPVALGSATASLLAEPPTEPATFPFGRAPATRPLSDAAISTRRQQARRQLLGLLGAAEACSAQQDPSSALPAGATLAAAMEGAEGPAGPGAPAQAGPLRSGAEECGVMEDGAGVDALTADAAYCPAVLVRHDAPGIHSVPGWSLVLPGGWVPPFWQALAFAGAKPAGQREWRWAATLQERPFFPHDFPDTQAYADLMVQLQHEQGQHAAKRPKGQFTPPAPYPPPWEALGATLGPAPQQQQLLQPADTAPATDASTMSQAPALGSGVPALSPAVHFVARSSGAAAAALWGWEQSALTAGEEPATTAAVTGGDRAARPLLLGLAGGRLQWRPRQDREQQAPSAGSSDLLPGGEGSAARPRCLLEVSARPVKCGTAKEGAQILGSLPAEAAAAGPPGTAAPDSDALQQPAAGLAAAEAPLQLLGFVTSELPRGGPKTGRSLGACCAAALWRLRSLQYTAQRRDGGEVRAFVRNPNSTALHPVRLRLRTEG